jgi:hypothetical protein
MHNLDRTALELEFAGETFETSFEGEGEFEAEGETPFSEAEAMELAGELLSVSSEQELNHFLGGLMKKAWRGVKKAAASPVGQMVAGGLKSIAKKALPMVGAAVGNMVAPGVGGMVGSKLASAAGNAFGLELEGLSAEDREFEVAKQFVQLAGEAAQNAANAAAGAPPAEAAKTAIVDAARKFAPGLVPALSKVGTGASSALAQGNGAAQGRWFRRGNTIVLVGA